MIDERVEDGHDEEHVGRRIAGAAVAVEVVADKVARTQKEMPKGVRQGAGADAPHVHDVQPHHPPRDAFVTSSLPAVGAVVAGVGMAAVGALVLLQLHLRRGAGSPLPVAESVICLFGFHRVFL